MRILVLGRYKDSYNGLMPFITEQAIALKDFGHEVDYFSIKGKGGLSYFRSRKLLLNKILEFQPDIIHAHYGLSGITAVLQNKVPVVTTFHNGETLTFLGNLLSSLFSLRANHVIYVAQHIYDKCFFKRKKNFSIIPCGVNLNEEVITDFKTARKELGFDPQKKYILFGGGFDNLRKNFPLLKAAIKLLPNKDQIVPIEMKGLSRQQICLLMSACDLFALPSKSEGSPQALKEAMACNCPILATDVADIKFLLGDLPGHFNCSFDPSNVAHQLQRALLFNGRTEGRKRIEELKLDNVQVAEKLVAIYQSILK